MEQRVAHCHLIASVLAADLVMSDSERAFLDRTMTKMGLTEDERDQVMHYEGADGAEATMRALPEDDRRRLVDDLVQAALVDGKLRPEETAIVKKITLALGL